MTYPRSHLKRPRINQGSKSSSLADALSSGSQHSIRRRKRKKSSFSSPLSLSSSASRLDSGTGVAHFQLPDAAINVAKYELNHCWGIAAQSLAGMVGSDSSEMVVNFDLLGHCCWHCVNLQCCIAVITALLAWIRTVEIGWSYNKSRPSHTVALDP